MNYKQVCNTVADRIRDYKEVSGKQMDEDIE